jgi:hypothetical protein
MDKIDFKKQVKDLYNVKAKEPFLVDVPARSFLMVDGAGDPNTAPAFQEAIAALYGVAYTIKFTLKFAGSKIEYVVPTLEGLWWTDNPAGMASAKPEDLKWRLLIPQPDHITGDDVGRAVADLTKKGKDSPALRLVRLEPYHEGLSAQLVHVGPYADEAKITIPRLMEFIAAQGRKPHGYHHEIYMSDPRRTKPENLKTILRQPVE